MVEHCPVCGGSSVRPVLELGELPVLPNARVGDRRRAAAMTRGPLELVVCSGCSHLFNRRFDDALLAYDASYDNSLHFSPTFAEHAEQLAARLAATFGLDGATVAEIGCGSADFLVQLCERTGSRGFGFDPSVDPDRPETRRSPRVSLAAREYPLDGSLRPDLLLTQHVLEHLEHPVALLRAVTPTIAAGGGCYHEVPNGAQMLRDLALWDLIFEHVSYFTPLSFRFAAERAGIEVTELGTAFGDQYLWLTGRPATGTDPARAPDAATVAAAVADAERFGVAVREALHTASERLAAYTAAGPVVLWGAGSKGVTYLNVVAGAEAVAGVVDVNPRKSGTFVPGTGHEIAGPAQLAAWEPAVVLVANPIYRDEIAASVRDVVPSARVELLLG